MNDDEQARREPARPGATLGWPGWLPGWRFVLAALLVLLGAGAALAILRGRGGEYYRAAALVARLETQAGNLALLQSETPPDMPVLAFRVDMVRALDQEIEATLTELEGLNLAASPRPALRPAVTTYRTRLTRWFALVDSGQEEAAALWASGQVEPSYTALLNSTRAARAVYEVEARQAVLVADLGAVLALLATATLLILLAWRGERARRFAALLAVEQQTLRQSEQRLRALVHNVADALHIVDRDGRVQFVTATAEPLYGLAPAALVGRPFFELVHPDDQADARALFADALALPGTDLGGEFRCRRAGDDWGASTLLLNNQLADPAVGGVIVTCRDISERKTFEEDLARLAFYDSLSGLPNRALFADRLAHALAGAQRRGRPLAVIFLDIDNFKVVNDSLGHRAGDALLAAVAQRLLAVARAGDTVARLGGDEFTILLEEVESVAGPVHVAERVASALRAPFLLEGREVVISFSMGIALSTAAHAHPDHLLREAEIAMYRAKATGRARYAVFDPSMNTRSLERLELERDLHRALERDELRLDYQLVANLQTGRVSGAEALVRWAHPRRGLLAPGAFIPLAEEIGLIRPIGRWVLRAACRQAREWQRRYPGNPPLAIAVNLSVRQLQHPVVVDEIAHILAETALPPASLILEITESTMMQDAEGIVGTLRGLKRLGVQLAVDDFGTGYSSLAYLRRFPLDMLKIDRSFVDGVGEEGEDAAIVRAILGLAGALGLRVTAEGLETPAQVARLRALGCHWGQGYLLARPAPAATLDYLFAAAARPLLIDLPTAPGRELGIMD